MSAYVAGQVCCVQEILAVAYSNVDCIAGVQGENVRDSGRNSDYSVSAEGDVGSSSMF